MTRYKKVCLIVLAVLVVTTGALYIWNIILESNLQPEEIPYLHPSDGEYVWDVVFDPKGNAWIYGNFGIRVYNNKGKILHEFTLENTPAIKYSENKGEGIKIVFDKLGQTWLVVTNQLYLWNGKDWIEYSKDFLMLNNSRITSIAFDTKGGVWIGTMRDGLTLMNSQSVTKYQEGNSSLSNDEIEDISIDSYGKVWIATWGGGINVYDGKQWQIINQENSPLLSDYVRSITFDSKGSAWIGVLGGLNVYDGIAWKNYTPNNSGIQENDWVHVTFDAAGAAWIETYSLDGFTIFDKNQWHFYMVPNKYWDRNSYNTITDNMGDLSIIERSTYLHPEVLSISKLPDNLRLISKTAVYLHLFISSGGMPLLMTLLIMIDLTIMFKTWWTLRVNLGLAVLTIGIGSLAAIFGMIGGLVGHQLRKSRKAEIVGTIIGLIPGILVSLVLLFIWIGINIAD